MKDGSYVLATKYHDGDPGDYFCVGYLKEIYNHFGTTRYIVVDNNDRPFIANGFRRCQPISRERGNWIVSNMKLIESGSRCVWFYYYKQVIRRIAKKRKGKK